ncbi:MAG: transcription-repair coupling factor [Gemmatales bacterium]|nr:transcription-repair coupling factor [Gemmatales bacterium]MDW7994173.1 transcription-repair coupling factor [Gemmatales bacterium]
MQRLCASPWWRKHRGQFDSEVLLTGAWGSSAALVIAALVRESSAHPWVVVLAHHSDLEAWAGDLTTFLGQSPTLFPALTALRRQDETPELAELQRLRLLQSCHAGAPPKVVLTTPAALMQGLPSPQTWAAHLLILEVGTCISPETVCHWLVEHGYLRRDIVELPGEFTRRGGIVDIYPLTGTTGVRIEWFGDEIESLRAFDTETQRSQQSLRQVEIVGALTRELGPGSAAPMWDSTWFAWLPESARVVLIETADIDEQARQYWERAPDFRGLVSPTELMKRLQALRPVHITAWPSGAETHTIPLPVKSVERFSGELARIRQEVSEAAARAEVWIVCASEAERQRFAQLLQVSENTPPSASPSEQESSQRPTALASSQSMAQATGSNFALRLCVASLRQGFRLSLADASPNEPSEVLLLTSSELLGREKLPARPRQVWLRRYEARAIDSFLDLNPGDYVVHREHGIARYHGLRRIQKQGREEEHLTLEFAGGVLLYVPVSRIDLVQKYIGTGQRPPTLSELSGTAWQKRKARAQAAIWELALDLLQMQARRQAEPGIAYPPDSDWQIEFESAFPYEETPDQLAALAAIKKDMEQPRPMDRLLCGDVGFGKTELAMRAAFKAMEFGKQVAVLVPTTILAEQHLRTFRSRFASYPFVIECLSRFRSPQEQRDIVRRLAEGKIDLVIGTHRLLSADVQFKDLGLVIIDEEQRFGVEHKERLKKLRATVDVLTMTATPIPRTLHMALLGIRDISCLETPPLDRQAIETYIIPFDRERIRQAIVRELLRDGQVFFVHNRVQTIYETANRLAQIVPEARIAVAHGQMPEDELEQTMLNFLERRYDVLIATSIIENGLDIPAANTIFIHHPEMFGLADLHQLRGRVGRSQVRAYCYLVIENSSSISPQAYRRIKAIEEYSELGAGFKIALRDLEIRGAGNLLGTEQSGHIDAIGYELYCEMLEQAVRQLRHQPVPTRFDVQIDLPWKAWIPTEYVGQLRLKMELYRRLSRIRSPRQLAEFRAELQDRFGPLPEPVDWLIKQHEIRLLAQRWRIASIHLNGPDLVLGYRQPVLMQKLARRFAKRLRIVDEVSAYYRLEPADIQPENIYHQLKTLLQSPRAPL